MNGFGEGREVGLNRQEVLEMPTFCEERGAALFLPCVVFEHNIRASERANSSIVLYNSTWEDGRTHRELHAWPSS